MISIESRDLARPVLPKPTCRVMLVCGPPASGKSTYVNRHKRPDDIVIDFDQIARRRGYGRERPSGAVGAILQERNDRMAALSQEPPERVAWVIIGAPSPSLRQWWCDVLAVAPGDMILLLPSREELRRRIVGDPDRKQVRALHFSLVDKWLAKERADDFGATQPGVGPDGYPIDPLHPFNKTKTRWEPVA